MQGQESTMKINDIIEKGKEIQRTTADQHGRNALDEWRRQEEERAAKLKRAMELRDDPRPLGFRRPDTSSDLRPNQYVHIVDRVEQLTDDPASACTIAMLVTRWKLVPVDEVKRHAYRRQGLTHELVAVLSGRSVTTEYLVSDLLYNHGVTAWIK
jgi:ribosomal protein L32E